MAHLFLLTGPSGVGKTTFLNEIFELQKNSTNQFSELSIMERVTTREQNKTEASEKDYTIVTKKSFLRKLADYTFIPHFEKYDKYYYGLDRKKIQDAINDRYYNYIVTTGIREAFSLKEKYFNDVTILFMYPCKEEILDLNKILNDFDTLKLDPDIYYDKSDVSATSNVETLIYEALSITPQIKDLIIRLIEKFEKISDIEKKDYVTCSNYIRKRMDSNYAEIMCVIGKLRELKEEKDIDKNKEDYIEILVAEYNKFEETIRNFQNIYAKFKLPKSEITANPSEDPILTVEKTVISSEADLNKNMTNDNKESAANDDNPGSASSLRNKDPRGLHKSNSFEDFKSTNKSEIYKAMKKSQDAVKSDEEKENLKETAMFLSCFCVNSSTKDYFSFSEIAKYFSDKGDRISDSTLKRKYKEKYELAAKNDLELRKYIDSIKDNL